MSDDYKEIVEWLLDLSNRLQAPGLENAADVIERLRAELATERERAERQRDRVLEVCKLLSAEEDKVAKLREALEEMVCIQDKWETAVGKIVQSEPQVFTRAIDRARAVLEETGHE